jgi:hypothetical protein
LPGTKTRHAGDRRHGGELADQAPGESVLLGTMSAHLGAYVRGMRQAPDLDLRVAEGYETCHRIVVDACEQLFAATKREAAAGLSIE